MVIPYFRKKVETILKTHGLIGAKGSSSAKDTKVYSLLHMGVVTSEVDPWQSGEIQVMHPVLAKPVSVAYSTPYHGKGGGGFWAIPEIGTTVLFADVPDGDPYVTTKKRYIYIASIPNPNIMAQIPGYGDEIQGPLQSGGVTPDDDIYKYRSRPMKYVWKSPKGHAFIMSDLYEGNKFNTRIEMISHLDKKVVCDDSPLKSCILIQNEHGDHIKLATDGVPPQQPARSLDVQTEGPQNYLTKSSAMELRVQDGLNLDILNTSTGKMSQNSPGFTGPPSTDWGKVNVMAQNNDITITANKGAGTIMQDIPSIFISTNGNDSLIQINSRGRMEVQINKSINIVSETNDINIVAQKGDINLTADEGDINLSTPQGKIYLN